MSESTNAQAIEERGGGDASTALTLSPLDDILERAVAMWAEHRAVHPSPYDRDLDYPAIRDAEEVDWTAFERIVAAVTPPRHELAALAADDRFWNWPAGVDGNDMNNEPIGKVIAYRLKHMVGALTVDL